MRPRFLPVAILLGCLAGNSFAQDKPNILFLFADDVGREVLGCYGGTSYETPNIDRLSSEGKRFSHCYSDPVCHPSRVCIMTGVYPARQGNPRWGDFAPTYQDKTFGWVLKGGGYTTAIAGKWQLALMKKKPSHPADLGFDRWSVFGWHEGPRYHSPMIYEDGGVREGTDGQYGPDLYTQFLIDFMHESKKVGKPFFAYYSMALCHDVTDDLKGKFVPFYKDDRWMNYTEMAASMDEMVGRIDRALDEMNLADNTVLIFATDNGTASASYSTVVDGKMVREEVWSEFGGKMIRGGKGSFTDWGTRVPLIVRWPGKIEPGSVADDLVDFSDFLPTLAGIAGVQIPGDWDMDGVSFLPRLLEEGPSPRKWAYSELRGKRFVRTHDFKLYNDGTFIDLRTNPDEKKSLAGPVRDDPEASAAQVMLQEAMASIPEPSQ